VTLDVNNFEIAVLQPRGFPKNYKPERYLNLCCNNNM